MAKATKDTVLSIPGEPTPEASWERNLQLKQDRLAILQYVADAATDEEVDRIKKIILG